MNYFPEKEGLFKINVEYSLHITRYLIFYTQTILEINKAILIQDVLQRKIR